MLQRTICTIYLFFEPQNAKKEGEEQASCRSFQCIFAYKRHHEYAEECHKQQRVEQSFLVYSISK